MKHTSAIELRNYLQKKGQILVHNYTQSTGTVHSWVCNENSRVLSFASFFSFIGLNFRLCQFFDKKMMKKVIPLRTTQLMLTWIGLLQDENSTSWQKFAHITFSFISLVLVVIHVAASVTFVVEFLSIDLERTLYAIGQIFGWSPFIYMSLVTLLLRPKITALIEELTVVSNSSMYSFYFLIW